MSEFAVFGRFHMCIQFVTRRGRAFRAFSLRSLSQCETRSFVRVRRRRRVRDDAGRRRVKFLSRASICDPIRGRWSKNFDGQTDEPWWPQRFGIRLTTCEARRTTRYSGCGKRRQGLRFDERLQWRRGNITRIKVGTMRGLRGCERRTRY